MRQLSAAYLARAGQVRREWQLATRRCSALLLMVDIEILGKPARAVVENA
ncbi:hypothetical protein [Falsiroseomonas sp. E2-1-a20]